MGLLFCMCLVAILTLSVFTSDLEAYEANDGDYYYKETTGICGDNVKWTYDKSSRILTLSGTGSMYDAGPDGLWPYNSQHLMKNYYKISHIEFKGSITHIGQRVFAYTSVETIKLPDSLESIGKEAFFQSKLTSIEFPNTLKKVSGDAFSNCKNLISIKFPSQMESIPFSIKDNPSLKTVCLPDNLRNFNGFDGCTSYVPDFSNCHSLESVTINKIGNCKMLIIPNTVRDVSICYPVVSSIKLGSNVSTFKTQCLSPDYVSVESSNPFLVVSEGTLYTKDMKTMVYYPSGKTDSSFTIPESVETIINMSNNNLKSLTVTKNVEGCDQIKLNNLEILNIPSNLKKFSSLPGRIACVPIDYSNTGYIKDGILLKYYSKYIDSVVATKISDGSYKIHINYNTDIQVNSIRVGSQYNYNDIQESEGNDFILNTDASDYLKVYLSIDTGEGDESPPAEYESGNDKSIWDTIVGGVYTSSIAIIVIILLLAGGGGGAAYYILVVRE